MVIQNTNIEEALWDPKDPKIVLRDKKQENDWKECDISSKYRDEPAREAIRVNLDAIIMGEIYLVWLDDIPERMGDLLEMDGWCSERQKNIMAYTVEMVNEGVFFGLRQVLCLVKGEVVDVVTYYGESRSNFAKNINPHRAFEDATSEWCFCTDYRVLLQNVEVVGIHME